MVTMESTFMDFLPSKSFQRDKKLRNACQDMLYSYATTGYPSFDGTDNWKPTKDAELTYMNVSDASNIKLQTADSLVPIEFWRSIGLLEYEKYSIKD
ncbi:hypothetical protein NQ318_000367 [Aromia moschata]|uniref:Uncharacterized protein n=1 Tax=Aromia moschata TaxID=1265417 RepID=A0AAV8YTV8_9CUCU|nr:hypothetical protein NQ318_000367 [Aromia moschata]